MLKNNWKIKIIRWLGTGNPDNTLCDKKLKDDGKPESW